ncbi:MAG: YqiA/YcfP family alpha/beta fold hydrolase, partial [Methylovulum sp.]
MRNTKLLEKLLIPLLILKDQCWHIIRNEPSVERLLTPGSKILYFFFGGIAGNIAMPPFEFYSASKIMNENKIFIRDFSQTWYHRGLRNISKDIDTTVTFLQKEINELKPEKVYFVGNSMGGYAAILFSMLLKQGDAIAFAPQTFLSPELRKHYGDMRWSKQIFNIYKLNACKNKAYDLRQLLILNQ